MAIDPDDAVYCDIQMPLAEGEQLLRLVASLRESKAHLGMDTVLQRMQYELELSIDLVVNPPNLLNWSGTRH